MNLIKYFTLLIVIFAITLQKPATAFSTSNQDSSSGEVVSEFPNSYIETAAQSFVRPTIEDKAVVPQMTYTKPDFDAENDVMLEPVKPKPVSSKLIFDTSKSNQ